MSTKPYEFKEWIELLSSTPYEKHLDLLLAQGIIKASDNGEDHIRKLDLTGDTIIISRLMGNHKSFAEAFEGIDIERLFYTYFSDQEYETMMLQEWVNNTSDKTELKLHKFQSKWKDLFKLFPISNDLKKDLPNGRFTVYRAGTPEGISWTTSTGIASWFYKKNKLLQSEPKYNRFLSLIVTKEEVVFYNDHNSENEVILVPNESKIKIIPYKEHKDFEEIIPDKV